jgi:hypothetical protein
VTVGEKAAVKRDKAHSFLENSKVIVEVVQEAEVAVRVVVAEMQMSPKQKTPMHSQYQ